MITGVIGPSDEEIEHLIKKCYIDSVYEKASLKFYSGFYGEAQVVLVICGVGKVNACIATQVLIDILEVTHIILTGAAGALGDSLKHGDVVISTAVAHHDLPQEILTEYHPWMKSIFIEADTAMVNECIRIAGEDQDHGNIYAGKMISGKSSSPAVKSANGWTPLGRCVWTWRAQALRRPAMSIIFLLLLSVRYRTMRTKKVLKALKPMWNRSPECIVPSGKAAGKFT